MKLKQEILEKNILSSEIISKIEEKEKWCKKYNYDFDNNRLIEVISSDKESFDKFHNLVKGGEISLDLKNLYDSLEGLDERCLDYGVWDISDIEFLEIGNENKIFDFKCKHPEWVIADGYGLECSVILSKKPNRIEYDDLHGCSFEGHGTLAVIDNCPKKILIMGEND